MAPTEAGYVAVVTGASGFIATELVAQLLAKGWNVRATVRSTKNPTKIAHLKALGEAFSGSLSFYEADLLKEGSFDEVVKDSDYVFHTASPYQVGIEDVENELIKPALQGTRNVLSSVVKSKGTVKRVILTSSFAAVIKVEKGPSNGKFHTEEDWNDEAKADKASGYMLSKTLAEREAWDIAKKNGLDLVVINPTGVFGPVVSERTDATSVSMLKALIEGSTTSFIAWQCDLGDVAKAHVRAAEVLTASGRFLVSQEYTVSDKAVLEVLARRFPQYKFGESTEDKKPEQFLSNAKVQKELGMVITPWQQSIIDMAVSLINKGVAKPVLA